MKLLSIFQHAKRHKIIALKKFSQNFIFDYSLCKKIVRVSGLKKGDNVLEIGPGTGGLTRAILDISPSILTAIELDQRFIPLLLEIKVLHPNLEIKSIDALRFNLTSLNCDTIKIISNLPYRVSTILIIQWLKQIHLISSMTLMLQLEVADRICAIANSKSYGRLSVISQLLCNVKRLFNISPKAFHPTPKVRSALISMVPLRNNLDLRLINVVEEITRFAFFERRKMIRSSLRKFSPKIIDILEELKIDSSFRAENLSPQDYLNLAKFYIDLK